MFKPFVVACVLAAALAGASARAGTVKPTPVTFSGWAGLLRQYSAVDADSSWRMNLNLTAARGPVRLGFRLSEARGGRPSEYQSVYAAWYQTAGRYSLSYEANMQIGGNRTRTLVDDELWQSMRQTFRATAARRFGRVNANLSAEYWPRPQVQVDAEYALGGGLSWRITPAISLMLAARQRWNDGTADILSLTSGIVYGWPKGFSGSVRLQDIYQSDRTGRRYLIVSVGKAF